MSFAYWLLFLMKTSARSLLRSQRRTLLSLASIASATAAILVFQSFVVSVTATTRENVITSYYGHYELMKKTYRPGKVDDPYGYQINDLDGLRDGINREVGPLAFISRRLEFYGMLNWNDRSVGGIGIGIDAAEERKFLTLVHVEQGRHLADSPEHSVFIGTGLADSLRIKVGDLATTLVTTATGSINANDLVVTGIFKTGVPDLDDRTFYVHHAVAESLLHVKGAPRLVIGFKDKDELQYAKPLAAFLAKAYPELRASHWQERATFYDNLMGWLNRQIYVFYAIVLTIAAISIVNVFSMGLLERTGEFGTLRAIGTSRSEMATMIFAESMVQGLAGALLGVLLGILLIVGPLAGGITMPPPPMMNVPLHVLFAVPWAQILPTIAMAAGVAGVSGILPAVRMSRLNIVSALGRNV